MAHKTFVVGDVHGHREGLERLLFEAKFSPRKHRLVLAGDLIDRGPDPAGVVRLVRLLGGESVLGNHEEKHLRYRRHEQRARLDSQYRIPMAKPHPETHDALAEADWQFLETLPLTIDVGRNTVVVHAGFSAESPVWRPQLNSLRIRYVDPVTRLHAKSSDGYTQSAGSVFWTTKYLGTKNVIYGHHSYFLPTKTVRPNGVWTLGIDTGYAFGGSLTGYWVESEEYVSVEAPVKFCSDISEPPELRLPPVRSWSSATASSAAGAA